MVRRDCQHLPHPKGATSSQELNSWGAHYCMCVCVCVHSHLQPLLKALFVFNVCVCVCLWTGVSSIVTRLYQRVSANNCSTSFRQHNYRVFMDCLMHVVRVAKGWNISDIFPESFQKSRKVSKIPGKFPKCTGNVPTFYIKHRPELLLFIMAKHGLTELVQSLLVHICDETKALSTSSI